MFFLFFLQRDDFISSFMVTFSPFYSLILMKIFNLFFEFYFKEELEYPRTNYVRKIPRKKSRLIHDFYSFLAISIFIL